VWIEVSAMIGFAQRKEWVGLRDELAKILGHSNIRMTERYAKLGKAHIARTGDTAREMWKLMSAVDEVHAATAV
jgi:hypothetical protein